MPPPSAHESPASERWKCGAEILRPSTCKGEEPYTSGVPARATPPADTPKKSRINHPIGTSTADEDTTRPHRREMRVAHARRRLRDHGARSPYLPADRRKKRQWLYGYGHAVIGPQYYAPAYMLVAPATPESFRRPQAEPASAAHA